MSDGCLDRSNELPEHAFDKHAAGLAVEALAILLRVQHEELPLHHVRIKLFLILGQRPVLLNFPYPTEVRIYS